MSASSSHNAAGTIPRVTTAEPESRTATKKTVSDPGHLLPEHASEPGGPPPRPWPPRSSSLLIILAHHRLHRMAHSLQQSGGRNIGREAGRCRQPPHTRAGHAVQQKTVPVFLTALGTVTAYNTVTLHSRVDGQLLQVNFQEGQAVRKGQLLSRSIHGPIRPRSIRPSARSPRTRPTSRTRRLRPSAIPRSTRPASSQGVSSSRRSRMPGQAAGSIKADQAAIEAARSISATPRSIRPSTAWSGCAGRPGQHRPCLGLHRPGRHHADPSHRHHLHAARRPASAGAAGDAAAARSSSSKPTTATTHTRLPAARCSPSTTRSTPRPARRSSRPSSTTQTIRSSPNQFVNVRLILSQRQNAIVVPTAAIESGNQGDYVFIVNAGPAPPDKLKNLPGGTPAKHHAPAAQPKRAGRPAPATRGPTKRVASRRSSRASPSTPTSFRSRSTLRMAPTRALHQHQLKAGQQVVVDGQEKLIDGAPVTPAQAHTIPAINNGGAVGATNPSAQTAPPAAGSGGLTPGSPIPPTSNYPGSGRSGRKNNQNGGQPAPSGGGSH